MREDFQDIRRPKEDFEGVIGKLTLAWAKLESGLAMFLNSIVDGRDHWRGHVLYYAGTNLQPRLQVIDQLLLELIEFDRRQEIVYPEWKKLNKAVREEAGARRNHVVHGQLVEKTDTAKKIYDRLIVPYHGVRTRKGQPEFHVADIELGVGAAMNFWRASRALGQAIEIIRSGGEATAKITEAATLRLGNGTPIIEM